MKKSLRLALLVCASFVGLAFAGPALAAYRPILQIEQTSYKVGAAVTADVFVFIPANDDPTAKVTILSPAGYDANLSAAPGTTIGSVLARVKAKALSGAELPLAGTVLVANPTDPTIQAAAIKCTGSATHAAIWVLNATLQGQTISIPVFVDRAGPLVRLQVCLPSPDIPEAMGGAKFGAQLVFADFTVRGVFSNAGARGEYEWSAIYTPYVAGTATPNAAGTVEWRTLVELPSSLTLAKVKTKRGFKLVGKLSLPNFNPRTIKLDVWSGKKRNPAPSAISFGSGKRIGRTPRLTRTGRYSLTRRAVRSTTYFQTRFSDYELTGGCLKTSPTSPVPCKGEFIAAITSNQVKVTKPKKRRR